MTYNLRITYTMATKKENPSHYALDEERFGTFVRMVPIFEQLFDLINRTANLEETSPSYWMKMMSMKGFCAFPFEDIVPEDEVAGWAKKHGAKKAIMMWKQTVLQALANESINDCYDINNRRERIELGELPFPRKPDIILELEKLAD